MKSLLVAITTFLSAFFLTIFYPFQYSYNQMPVVYYLLGFPFDFVGFTEREIHHMADVRLLVLIGLFIFIVLGALCFFQRSSFTKKDMYYSSVILYGFFFLFCLFFVFYSFRDLFVLFHEVLFWNDLWLLPTGSQLLILFPESFFFSQMMWIIANTLILSGLLSVTTKYKTVLYNYMMRKR